MKTVPLPVPEQPEALVPDTVYTVFTEGVTAIELAFEAVFQV